MSIDRSAALRRLGITEWLPRNDAALIADVDAMPQVSAVPVVAVQPMAEVPAVKPAPITTDRSVSLARDSSSAEVEQTATATPSLRGRMVAGTSAAPLLVLAMADKSARDTLLNTGEPSGALLQAMLASMNVPASVALLGVGGGETIAVPRTILVLGERSARLLLGNDIAAPLRGRVHRFGNAHVVVSYHPDELRQNGSLKRLAWDDLRLLAGLLGREQAVASFA